MFAGAWLPDNSSGYFLCVWRRCMFFFSSERRRNERLSEEGCCCRQAVMKGVAGCSSAFCGCVHVNSRFGFLYSFCYICALVMLTLSLLSLVHNADVERIETFACCRGWCLYLLAVAHLLSLERLCWGCCNATGAAVDVEVQAPSQSISPGQIPRFSVASEWRGLGTG
jgi:hypothetical protein